RSVPWYALVSGVGGLVILSAVSYAIPRVGTVATVTTLIVAGQLLLSVMLDHFGLFGMEVRHLDLSRLIGLSVLFVGVWLTVR
ncbi:MAG: DMT family transporter, partial [Aggregatilineaceae bacterium]